MRRKKIFITGISGCVGHYLFDQLIRDPQYELHLLIRQKSRLRFNYRNSRIKLYENDFRRIEQYKPILKKMDYLIHVAAGWGGNSAWRINHDRTHLLFSLLDKKTIKKIIYFSTASILDNENKLLPEASKLGTSYIQSKARMFQELAQTELADRIITLFPTGVFGGDKNHPYSHLSGGIKNLNPWLLRLIRYFKVDFAYHYIHAHDIALIAKHLLDKEDSSGQYVLGNKLISWQQTLDTLLRSRDLKPARYQLNATGLVQNWLPRLFRRFTTPWGRYCLGQSCFPYQTHNVTSFGLSSPYTSLEACVKVQ